MPQSREDFKRMMHFHYMMYIAMPYHKNPCPGGIEMPRFTLLYIQFVSSMPMSRREDFVYQFYTLPHVGSQNLLIFFVSLNYTKLQSQLLGAFRQSLENTPWMYDMKRKWQHP